MELIRDLIKYALVVVFVILLKIYVVSPIQVFGESMEPTLKEDEIMILNKISYRFKELERFEIVVVEYDDPKFLIKRIVGLPEEKIEYKDNMLYINDLAVEESMITEPTEDYGPIVIPKDTYFVVGDNRDNSVDSRSEKLGLVEKTEIEGKSHLVIWPFSSFGLKK